jgi:hypothetical protein
MGKTMKYKHSKNPPSTVTPPTVTPTIKRGKYNKRTKRTKKL